MDFDWITLLKDGGGWAVALYLVTRVTPLLRALVDKLKTIEEHDRSQRASLLQLVLLIAHQTGMDTTEIEREIAKAANGNGKAGD